MHSICPILWVIQMQTQILLSTKEYKYISLFWGLMDVLPLMSLMKEIKFLLKIQRDTPNVLCGIFQSHQQSIKNLNDKNYHFPKFMMPIIAVQ